ncbi:MAG TPA: hypothetical protein VH417_09990 [Vicinamibacterales bacterium]
MTRPSTRSSTPGSLIRRHLAIGWWSILLFSALGLLLELLHGFKIAAYLDVGNETRRLMWTLAHAHGTLLGLIHIAFAATLGAVTTFSPEQQRTISKTLVAATIVLPGGFFAAGIRFYSGDPGIAAAVVPVGAALLLLAVWLIARNLGQSKDL